MGLNCLVCFRRVSGLINLALLFLVRREEKRRPLSTYSAICIVKNSTCDAKDPWPTALMKDIKP